MKNVKCRVEGSKLYVEIDLEQRLGESATGKSVTIASTSGNRDAADIPGLPAGVKLGVNCFTKK